MALKHCKAPKRPPARPCRTCSTLQWEIEGLRQKLRDALAERDQLQQRIYALIAERGRPRT